eukprot:NODE_99_length_2682_cov_24.646575_g95_i0.p1 GENE.NODE_99_length_2682_cov_24.646575_g95_i0~~NODE_99_length_2682_cov_24.646575_g95_i0.p1  ORF type:complete len:372 (-),score=97.59 NODE_99_length_2682_cov_24.646575_g95_i0:145-1260(-)
MAAAMEQTDEDSRRVLAERDASAERERTATAAAMQQREEALRIMVERDESAERAAMAVTLHKEKARRVLAERDRINLQLNAQQAEMDELLRQITESRDQHYGRYVDVYNMAKGVKADNQDDVLELAFNVAEKHFGAPLTADSKLKLQTDLESAVRKWTDEARQPKALACVLWTLHTKLESTERSKPGTQLYKMVNPALCEFLAQSDAMQFAVARLARVINQQVVVRPLDGTKPECPEETYRGCHIPAGNDAWKLLALTCKEYAKLRIAGYMSTSKKHNQVKQFLRTSHGHLSNPAYTIITVKFPSQLCQHVCLIPSAFAEEEYLFPPCSVFEVEHVELRDNPTVAEPHQIVLRAVVNNLNERDDLPVLIWY